jgi:hypothetical protein
MMTPVRPHSIGLVFAAFLALWHVVWALLVWGGVAQPFLDFIFRLHMIAPPFQVGPFRLGTAAGLVAVTASIGYVTGCVAGWIWNRFQKSGASVPAV